METVLNRTFTSIFTNVNKIMTGVLLKKMEEVYAFFIADFIKT